jgi:hypothetical protein
LGGEITVMDSSVDRGSSMPALFDRFQALEREWALSSSESSILTGASVSDLKNRVGDPNCGVAEKMKCLLVLREYLHCLYSPPLAAEWVRLKNSNALFGGRSPLEIILEGGSGAVDRVTALLRTRSRSTW